MGNKGRNISNGCIKVKDFTGRNVIRILEKSDLKINDDEYVSLFSKKLDGTSFAFLIAIIISQNTTDKAAITAYKRLRSVLRGRVTPERIISLGPELMEMALKPAGLARQKSKWIYEVAKHIIELGGERILEETPPKELRKILLSIPGIGEKTVDVYLSQMRNEKVFAVDTHARRIAKRWCLTESDNYQKISSALNKFFQGCDLVKAHKLIIALGRKWCRARNPRCDECPLKEICPYAVRKSLSITKQEKSIGRNRK